MGKSCFTSFGDPVPHGVFPKHFWETLSVCRDGRLSDSHPDTQADYQEEEAPFSPTVSQDLLPGSTIFTVGKRTMDLCSLWSWAAPCLRKCSLFHARRQAHPRRTWEGTWVIDTDSSCSEAFSWSCLSIKKDLGHIIRF